MSNLLLHFLPLLLTYDVYFCWRIQIVVLRPVLRGPRRLAHARLAARACTCMPAQPHVESQLKSICMDKDILGQPASYAGESAVCKQVGCVGLSDSHIAMQGWWWRRI